MLRLTEKDLTPLLPLETMIQIEHVPIAGVHVHVNTCLQIVSRRNLWHGIFPKSFSALVFNKHREKSWVTKNSSF